MEIHLVKRFTNAYVSVCKCVLISENILTLDQIVALTGIGELLGVYHPNE